MKRFLFLYLALMAWLWPRDVLADVLEDGWEHPPMEARLRAYWWWLNGNVTEQSITRDLEGMKEKGFAGAVLFDAGGASQDGNAPVPAGPVFGSPAWRTLYLHTLREAARLGLEISLNIQSGWNLGGPMVPAADAPKKLVWTDTRVSGGARVEIPLPAGKSRAVYQDIAVIALPAPAAGAARLEHFAEKALQAPLKPFSAPESEILFEEKPDEASAAVRLADVRDLGGSFDAAGGMLRWDAPPGTWQVLRIGWTLNDHCRVSTSSDGWGGYAIDPYDDGAFRRYWDAAVEPLLVAAGPPAGRSLKYLHTDSWEIELANWTPGFSGEFRKRRGYDPMPWMPVMCGRILENRDLSNRFLADYRKTMGDLAIDRHYRIFRERARAHGLLIHPESGGPHAVPIDAQCCLGADDAPMSEFWAWSWTHRVGDENRFFVKQPASAAHTYGRPMVLAEGFTTIGPHWQETLWDNLKPSFDKALCEGLNGLVWHAFVCSPDSTGIPGQQYFAGTHLNPKVTWWSRSEPFFGYINRCQFLLRQGRFAADVLYYYGDHVPDFARLKHSDPAHTGPGYDYDVITEEALTGRVSVKDGRLVLPDGMSYRMLMLPDHDVISPAVLRKVAEIVRTGGTVAGRRPERASTLEDHPRCDREVRGLAAELWDPSKPRHVLAAAGARGVLGALGVEPDCEFRGAPAGADLDFIHRTDAGAEMYFVANRAAVSVRATVSVRVSGLAPEIWDPVSGRRRPASAWSSRGGRTDVPLEFPPCGSFFLVFRSPAGVAPAVADGNRWIESRALPVDGTWKVSFDPRWGGPAVAEFPSLVPWNQRAEEGIRHYSGTATYRLSFTVPPGIDADHAWIDLGRVRELAEVRLNGTRLGIVWAPPFRVPAARALRPGENQLEIDVVNFWPNRIIGDAALPEDRRFTRTNIRKLTAGTPLVESGLLGPVRLVTGSDGGKDG